MKRIIGITILMAIAAAAEDYRTFTAADGRTLKARVLEYNGTTDQVQIEREDGKKLTVAPAAFSEKDQKYIKSREAASAFMSASKFKLDISRDEVKNTRKDHEVDIGEEFSGGRRGGASGVVTVATDKTTQYKYKLSVENKSSVPLSNITMEYRIYYSQQKAVKDAEANEDRREDDPRPERHMAVDEDKVKDGRGRLNPVEPKETRDVATSAVTLLKRSANRQWGDMIDLKSSLSGVWIKLTMRGPDGQKLIREIASPESVMKKFPWDPPESDEKIQQEP